MDEEHLERLLDKCRSCSPRGHRPVMGEGAPGADIMLIGQNPGAEEVKQGRPFVGRSGRYLDKVLRQYGIKREELYITSVVKCQTPGNRAPTSKEIESCLPLLVEQIKEIRPRLVVLMGKVAWKTPRLEGIKYIETYHPAAAMRFPVIKKRFEEDFRRIKENL